MSTISLPHLSLVALALGGAGLAACGADVAAGAGATPAAPTTTIAPVPSAQRTPTTTSLTATEIDGLLWMREEEQLAHDVYVALAERWDIATFSNIAESEARHVASVVSLLDRFGIADPAAGNAPGEFTDPTLQAMYDELVAEGSRSEIDALTVGARIEELDIRDLRDRLATTDDPSITRVYTQLERASGQHLDAFTRGLDRLGVTYVPELIDPDASAAGVELQASGRGNGRRAGR